MAVLEKVRHLLGYRFSIAELIGIAFLVGFPYLLVGVLWSINHTDHLHQMHGADLMFSLSVLGTPVKGGIRWLLGCLSSFRPVLARGGP